MTTSTNTNTARRFTHAQNGRYRTASTELEEEVKAMSLFESRQARGLRAWDELSEIDRAVLLEAVRQRRKLQAKRRMQDDMYLRRFDR